MEVRLKAGILEASCDDQSVIRRLRTTLSVLLEAALLHQSDSSDPGADLLSLL